MPHDDEPIRNADDLPEPDADDGGRAAAPGEPTDEREIQGDEGDG